MFLSKYVVQKLYYTKNFNISICNIFYEKKNSFIEIGDVILKNIKIIVIIVGVIIAGLYFVNKKSTQKTQIVSVQNLMSVDTLENESTAEDEEYIKIHIYGEVNSPRINRIKGWKQGV